MSDFIKERKITQKKKLEELKHHKNLQNDIDDNNDEKNLDRKINNEKNQEKNNYYLRDMEIDKFRLDENESNIIFSDLTKKI